MVCVTTANVNAIDADPDDYAAPANQDDPYAGIEFDEINEATALEVDEIKCLKKCFDLFDSKKQDFLSAGDLDNILRAMRISTNPRKRIKGISTKPP